MAQEVVGPGIFVQAADEIGDSRFEIRSFHERGVKEKVPGLFGHPDIQKLV